ncbi:MAG TPA: hypothetical protein VN397_01815 [Candidatus Methylomirabilis sp.]|nr:hypothetical protein [Candidatus Methylomirabilis sp.]
MRRLLVVGGASVLTVFAVVTVVFAVDQTSTNFQNFDSSAIPTQFIQTSGNYRVDGSVEPIVSKSNSGSFIVEHGSALKEGTPPVTPPTPTPTPSGGSGGGGGGGAPPAAAGPLVLTLDYRSPTFQRTQQISGSKDTAITRMLVNGSPNGVVLLSSLWQRVVPLFLGQNTVTVQGITASGQLKALRGAIQRLLIGDANVDRVVDDYDLSLLSRSWKTATFMTDYNENGTVDDYDLSLLIANWGVIY